MSKRKERKLNSEQYHKWRLALELMQHSETRGKMKAMELRVKELEIQNLTLRMNIFKGMVTQKQAEFESSKTEYLEVKAKIEEELGFSLTNCAVDDITFEVKDLEETI